MLERSRAAPAPDTEGEPRVDGGLAWLVAVPAGLLTVVLMLLFGAPLGRLLLAAPALDFWPGALKYVRPEPTEQARYLIALAGAVMVPLALMAQAWRPTLRRRSERWALAVQVGFVAIMIAALFCQLGTVGVGIGYFTVPTVLVALAVGLGFMAALRHPPALALATSLLGEDSRRVRWGAALAATLATAIWLLPAIQLDSMIADANTATSYGLIYTYDEGLSVLNGHTPLVDYAAQYGSLWPYVIAIPLHLGDASLGSFTLSMVAITLLAMLAVYGVIRRVCRSPLGALALYLPFLATSFFFIRDGLPYRYSFADYFGIFPLRYAGPYFVAFLLARHLSGARPRAAIWIFLVAGFTLLNNGDFGVPALGATIIALVAAAERPRTRGWWGQLSFEAVGGLLAAFAVVSIVTLARTGEIPDLDLLFRYARLFALAGYAMKPMQWFGFWVIIYLTFCSALVVATIMVLRRDSDRTSTGMLAWIGIFGLGIGSYYAGRSHPEVLIAMFSAWSLAVVLLVAVTTRFVARAGRRVAPAQLALFVGFGLLVCSLAQFPAPWRSVELLQVKAEREAFQPVGEADFIAAHTRPGEPVVLLMVMGQRASRRAGVENLMPYSGILSMPTEQQLDETVRRLHDAGGSKIFLREGEEAWPQLIPALKRKGFRQAAVGGPTAIGSLPLERLLMFSDAEPLR
jgi:hypothetical protein